MTVQASITTPLVTRPQYMRWMPKYPRKNHSTYAKATDRCMPSPPGRRAAAGLSVRAPPHSISAPSYGGTACLYEAAAPPRGGIASSARHAARGLRRAARGLRRAAAAPAV
ncbi:hypothetical protein GCM10010885_24060 [Alicyclobacillus cellulosilyticus]|uniref:Uncharacterized protein n=1 Tax=Alicyclobacillus cellulosilyticus TaxID=1003997 RepID=A0A917KI73_9BACL|nr:hypothetical protein GCM10010885_24060 [Alicyclobacillus cellulosilyticus]